MTTLAEFMIIAGADKHPLMLEKSMYDSWKSRMKLYIENRENRRMIFNSVLNGLLVWPTIVEKNGTNRTKKYEELLVAEKLQADCNLKATNIVLKGLPVPMFSQGDDPVAYLNKEMAFLLAVAATSIADLGIPDGQAAQTTLSNTAAFQIEDLDAYDSDCDDVSNAKAVLMANLSIYGSNVISEATVQDTNLYAQQDSMILSLIEQIDIDFGRNFGKRFVPQKELSPKQAFWLQTSHSNTEQSASSLAKIKAPKELLKDTSSDDQNALEVPEYLENNDLKAQLQAKDTTIYLKGQIQEKVFVTTTLQNELRKLKGKNMVDNATIITTATTIAPGMFKLDLDPLVPRLLKNRDTHIDYLKYTQEQEDILWGRVEQAKATQPLDNALDFSYKHAK
nr:hypothetical protein [Tanacetum cinerariifolium]